LTSCGVGYKPIDDKSESLTPYRFSIVIENDKSPHYFSEKIVDCLLCGTVPIYWGADKIGEYFNTNGFFVINSIDDINDILPKLNEKTYNNMLPFVEENYKIASQYLTVEDYMYNKYLKNI
jgi:regulator of sigma D